FAPLLLLAGCPDPAIPQPAPINPKPPVAACAANSAAIFEIDHDKDAGNFVTSKTVVLASGAWSYEDSTGAHRSGCLSAGELAQVTALHQASWTVEHPAPGSVQCLAFSAEFVDYLVDGKHVWRDRVCTGDSLDQA